MSKPVVVKDSPLVDHITVARADSCSRVRSWHVRQAPADGENGEVLSATVAAVVRGNGSRFVSVHRGNGSAGDALYGMHPDTAMALATAILDAQSWVRDAELPPVEFEK